MIGPGIAALLVANTACASAIGPVVYPLVLPTKAPLPCVTYQVISNVPMYTMDGLSFSKARVQINAWGLAYEDAAKVTETIRTVLDGYFGTLPNGLAVGTLFRDNGTDQYEPDSLLYSTRTDWVVIYTE